MARLFEHQGKHLLASAGIPVPRGEVTCSAVDAARIAEQWGGSAVVKAQVWSTGRSKAGGILVADDVQAAFTAAEKLLSTTIKDFPVQEVLVEERLDIAQEFYAGIIIDDSFRVRAPVVIFSLEGGVDIEDLARRAPDRVARLAVDPLEPFDLDNAGQLLGQVQSPTELVEPLGEFLVGLYQVFKQYDARSLEINPLVLTRAGKLIAADCRLSIDDASVHRHPELSIEVARESDTPPSYLDHLAWDIEKQDYRGSSYFAEFPRADRSEARIGFHAIGGGGALLAVDTLVRKGLVLANFAETSGNPPASKVYRIAKIILALPALAGYCLLGPVMASQDQWHHAHGLLKAFREELGERQGFPIVIMLAGNKEPETMDLLHRGLADLPVRYQLYGREYIYQLDQVADQMKAFVDEYWAEIRA